MNTLTPRWPGALIWTLSWPVMLLLDGHVDLANLALVLVLTAALAGVWLTPVLSMLACAAAVLAFNFVFVPPRGTFTVDVHQHALLLITMLAVSWTVSLLMARQRQLASGEHLHALRAEQLQVLGDKLRDADDLRTGGVQLQLMLSDLIGAPAALLMVSDMEPMQKAQASSIQLGAVDGDERAGLELTQRQGCAMGPGTGRHEEQPAWYLPLRGRRSSFGAALLRLPIGPVATAAVRNHAQALCDQMGLAIERAVVTAAAAAAREEAQAQTLRNTLLTAISHDYRTPLATIMSSASSLHDQGDRLSDEQRRRLAATIVDEAEQLARLTANTLQLARLDMPGVVLRQDWESVEEIVGTVVRRVRQRAPLQRLKLRLEPGLPLLRCDAVLLVQMLENLVDNALKYGGEGAPVEVMARHIGDQVVLAVRDRGPGIAPAWRDRIFDVFQRVDSSDGAPASADAPTRRGAGVGLAMCRAVARAHGGELRLRPRSRGGSSFECTLPVVDPPACEPGVEERKPSA